MNVYRFGPFTLDAAQLLLLHDGVPLPLGPKVVETLLALVEKPGEIQAKSELLDRIWPEGYVDEANLAQNVYVLRKAFKARWGAATIETIPRRGYRFVAPVALLAPRPAPAVPIASEEPATLRVPVWRRAVGAVASLAVIALVAAALGVAQYSPGVRAQGARLSATGSRLYAIGRYNWNLRTHDGVAKSLAYFAQVVDSDPRNPLGYAGLAQANATIADYGYGLRKPAVYLSRARAYADKALALDASSSDGYAALGLIDIDEGHSARARVELERSLLLDPNNGPAHEWYGTVLLEQGNASKAFQELKTAAALDPLSVATAAWLGDAAYLNHHFAEAIAYARQTMDLSPSRRDAWMTMGLAYEAQGDYGRALAAFHSFKESGRDCHAEGAALLAQLYGRMHRTADARRELAIALAHPRDVFPADIGFALVALGERRDALPYFRKVRRSGAWTAIAQDPRAQTLPPDAS